MAVAVAEAVSRSIKYLNDNNYALIGTEAITDSCGYPRNPRYSILTDTALHWVMLTGNKEREMVLFLVGKVK